MGGTVVGRRLPVPGGLVLVSGYYPVPVKCRPQPHFNKLSPPSVFTHTNSPYRYTVERGSSNTLLGYVRKTCNFTLSL